MPSPRKPIEVILKEAQPAFQNRKFYFVLITNVPFVGGTQKSLTITVARPKHEAESIKYSVEKALHEFRRPRETRRPKKPKTAWARLGMKKEIIPS